MTAPSAEMRAGLPDHLGYIGDGDLRLIWQASHNAAVEACAVKCGTTKGGYTASLDHVNCLVLDPDGPWGLNADFAAAIRELKVMK